MQPHDANQPNEGRLPGGEAVGKNKPTNQPPAILNTAPTPSSLFRCLQRRLVQAVFLGLVLGGGAAALAWYFAPIPKHQVRMLVRVPQPGPVAVADSPERIPDQNSQHRMLVASIRNRPVLNAALKDPEVAKLPLIKEMFEPIEWLEREVQVDFALAPDMMRISMRGMETDDLKVLVAAIYRAFLREIVDGDSLRRKGRESALNNMIRTYEEKLTSARSNQKLLESQHGVRNAKVRGVKLSFKEYELQSTQREVAAARSNRTKLKATLDNLLTAKPNEKTSPVREADILTVINRNLTIVGLKNDVATWKAKLALIESRTLQGKNDDSYKKVEKQLKEIEKQLGEETQRARADAIKSLDEFARANRETTIALMKQRLAEYEETIKQLEPVASALLKELGDLDAQGAAMDRVEDQTGHLEKMLNTLRHQAEAVKVEMELAPKFTIFEDTTVVRADPTTRKIQIAGVAGGGLFLFALVGIAWLEYRTRKVASVDDVVLGLGMRLVGTVPNARRSARSAPTAGNGKKVPSVSQQVLTESIDAARTTLLHLARSHSLRTVMVTSAVSGEGKTSLSCHLAASLSRAGLRVLLIDADMRNPSAHKLFGMQCETGFSEVLCGKVQASDCIKETPLRNLWLLPAGFWTDQTAAALNQGQAAALFEQFRQQFDIIVVDSSPVLPVADALLIGQQVDAVVLSVLCQVSSLNNLYAAWTRVQDHGGQPLGVVINGVSSGGYGAYYHYPYPRKKAKA